MSEEKLTLGEYFRREREKKGLDLKEIEERTKIPAQTLIFLEENQLDMLPPRTFLRGFLRVISKEFDFDEEEILAHLEETLSSHENMNKQVKIPSYRAKPVLPMLLIIAAAVLIVIAIFVFSLRQCQQAPNEDIKTGSLSQVYVDDRPEPGRSVFL
ncbi:MAG TPA: helix-turn-helix domain-containing protein [Deltaproteobacteria bacterium]|nr:helix-turn-helix domain-containing protein [Deltaproteobacteria bacterium]HPR53983.1 helix-turn-helix domain-containing protein [Deltaproteobacteria bacterium]HXK46394.1 helix-turn-helix domain-containing protein [Deltaproteobacteria bacterium]